MPHVYHPGEFYMAKRLRKGNGRPRTLHRESERPPVPKCHPRTSVHRSKDGVWSCNRCGHVIAVESPELQGLALPPRTPLPSMNWRDVVTAPVEDSPEQAASADERVVNKGLFAGIVLAYTNRGQSSEVATRNAALGMRLLGLETEPTHEISKAAQYNTGRFEVIEVTDDWGMGHYRSTIVTYVARAPHKGTCLKDLRKAKYYLDRLIQLTEEGRGELGILTSKEWDR